MACSLPSTETTVIRTAKEAVDDNARPDISWIPSFKVFRDRVERLRALYPDRRTTLPPGWPAQVDAPRAWASSNFESENDYVLRLSAEDIAEIEAGLAHFKGQLSQLPWPLIQSIGMLTCNNQRSLVTSARTTSAQPHSHFRI
jgi:hypothetical protein